MDPHRARITLRVDQRVPPILHPAARVQLIDGGRHYPVVTGEPGGLHVDDRIPLGIRGRPRGRRFVGGTVYEHGHREYGAALTPGVEWGGNEAGWERRG
ncbi:hypothetical protein GCM10010319_19550 [Streptomyces blastmyceticus]|uniref:Uncharacterized protein n=1 Tax=Streptomyces blastmyceticus TaxID=68180 RepID=A0ABP3GGW3_9ACTN